MLGIGRKRASTATRRSTIVFAGLIPVLLTALLKLAAPSGFAQVSGLVFDSYQRLSPRPYRDAGVRVVDIDDESVREGVYSIGAPVFDATGRVVAGVAVCINKALLGADRGERYRDAALQVARTLSQRLGGEVKAARAATRQRKAGGAS